jgi:hypothetical protein
MYVHRYAAFMTYRRAGSLEKAVRAALTAKPPAPSDVATAELALTLALRIDEDEADYRTAGALLAALEALQMSPRSRAAAHRGEVKDVPAGNPLDQLAARRARAGQRRADDGHATAT